MCDSCWALGDLIIFFLIPCKITLSFVSVTSVSLFLLKRYTLRVYVFAVCSNVVILYHIGICQLFLYSQQLCSRECFAFGLITCRYCFILFHRLMKQLMTRMVMKMFFFHRKTFSKKEEKSSQKPDDAWRYDVRCDDARLR